MIFLTVGTQFPFDRLVRAVDEAVDRNLVHDPVYAQIGTSSYRPRNFESVTFLDKHKFDELCRRSSAIISHAGMGIITLALEYNKPLLVMPRLKKHGEVVNDHQVAIAGKLTATGFALAAKNSKDLMQKIKKLKSFRTPNGNTNNNCPLILARVSEFLNQLDKKSP